MTQFQASRTDGRSDTRVILDLAGLAEPETQFTYDEIQAALEAGLGSPVTLRRVYAAVRMANRAMLREHHRYLAVVRGRGYRVIRGDEHVVVALSRRDRAETQMKRGVEILRNVNYGDLSTTQRQIHEGQLLIMSALYRAIEESNKSQTRQQNLIDDLAKRMERLEGKGAS